MPESQGEGGFVSTYNNFFVFWDDGFDVLEGRLEATDELLDWTLSHRRNFVASNEFFRFSM